MLGICSSTSHKGHLTSWTRGGSSSSPTESTNILAFPLTFDIYRALKNNDAGGDNPNGAPGSQGRAWRDARVHLAKNHRLHETTRSPSSSPPTTNLLRWEHDDGVDVFHLTVKSRIAPPVLARGIDVTTTYRFMANTGLPPVSVDDDHDALHIRVQATGTGP